MTLPRPLVRPLARGLSSGLTKSTGPRLRSSTLAYVDANTGTEQVGTPGTWRQNDNGTFGLLLIGDGQLFGFPSSEFIGAVEFTGGSIPPAAATIESAVATFGMTLHAAPFTVTAQDADEPPVPGAGNLPSGWSVTSATAAPTAGTGTKNVDIKGIVQELVNRPGWNGARINLRFRVDEFVEYASSTVQLGSVTKIELTWYDP